MISKMFGHCPSANPPSLFGRIGKTSMTVVFMLGMVRLLGTPASGGEKSLLPVTLRIPPGFTARAFHCCAVKIKVIGFWRYSEDRVAPAISVMEEQTSARTIEDYVRSIIELPDQTITLDALVKRCGAEVAILSVKGFRHDAPVVGTQAILLSPGQEYTVSYTYPANQPANQSALNAVRSVCLASPA